MSEDKNRRRNYYIKKEFQRNFILKFCSLVLLGSVMSGAMIYWISKATVTTSFDNLRLVIKSTADYMLPAVLLSSVVMLAVTGAVTVFITLFTSHKIAGPLYRIEKDIREVASGNLAREFNLREGDEVRPIAEGLNGMVKFLKTEVNAIKKVVTELESASATPGVSQDVKDKIKALRVEVEKLKT